MFKRKKRINGSEYLYLVRNVRDGRTVRQKVIRYLGPVKPIYKTKKR